MSGNLYDLRIQLEMTHSELGAAAGVSPDTIRSLERDEVKPATKTAVALTKYFSRELGRVVPATELFGRPERHLSVVPTDPEEAA